MPYIHFRRHSDLSTASLFFATLQHDVKNCLHHLRSNYHCEGENEKKSFLLNVSLLLKKSTQKTKDRRHTQKRIIVYVELLVSLNQENFKPLTGKTHHINSSNHPICRCCIFYCSYAIEIELIDANSQKIECLLFLRYA